MVPRRYQEHSDGTFDIDYDDGESERNVKGVMSERRVDEAALGRRIRMMMKLGSCDGSFRDLEDKITTDRARSLSRSDDRRRSRSPDDIESLKRENRELRKTLQRGGPSVPRVHRPRARHRGTAW